LIREGKKHDTKEKVTPSKKIVKQESTYPAYPFSNKGVGKEKNWCKEGGSQGGKGSSRNGSQFVLHKAVV